MIQFCDAPRCGWSAMYQLRTDDGTLVFLCDVHVQPWLKLPTLWEIA